MSNCSSYPLKCVYSQIFCYTVLLEPLIELVIFQKCVLNFGYLLKFVFLWEFEDWNLPHHLVDITQYSLLSE